MYIFRRHPDNIQHLFISYEDKNRRCPVYNVEGGSVDLDTEGHILTDDEDFLIDLDTLRLMRCWELQKKLRVDETINVFKLCSDVGGISSVISRSYLFDCGYNRYLHITDEGDMFLLENGIYSLILYSNYHKASILDLPHWRAGTLWLVPVDERTESQAILRKVDELTLSQLKRKIIFETDA